MVLILLHHPGQRHYTITLTPGDTVYCKVLYTNQAVPEEAAEQATLRARAPLGTHPPHQCHWTHSSLSSSTKHGTSNRLKNVTPMMLETVSLMASRHRRNLRSGSGEEDGLPRPPFPHGPGLTWRRNRSGTRCAGDSCGCRS